MKLNIFPSQPWVELIPYKPLSYLLNLGHQLYEINVNHNRYYKQRVYLIILWQAIVAIHSVPLVLFPLSHVQRVQLFDTQHLQHFESRFSNILLIDAYAAMGYCFSVIYLSYHPRMYQILMGILIYQNREYFPHGHMVKCGHLWPVVSYIQVKMLRVLNLLQPMVLLLGMIVLVIEYTKLT